MKNLRIVVSKQEIHEHMMDLWETESFRDSHRTGGFIYQCVEQFAWLPRIFADMTNDQLERAHFSTWWGVMMNRDDYTNPVIHDLYWLHEMFHAGNMPYIPGIGRQAFDEKMQRNELEASVLSEIQVYFEMPELRAKSFDYPIYADRFLEDPEIVALWKINKHVAIETIRTIRRNVMLSKPEHLMDITELWIRRFAEQNSIYAITWSDRYNEIEQAMHRFQMLTVPDDDARRMENDARLYAVHKHAEWIFDEAIKDKVNNIPFRQEAELFSAFYLANKDKYAAAMAASK
jgi:predicted double-glycine peptidase